MLEGGNARRVVVTGLGAVTPLGPDTDTTWRRLLAGESGGGPITSFDPDGHPVRIACEAGEFEPAQWLERKTLRKERVVVEGAPEETAGTSWLSTPGTAASVDAAEAGNHRAPFP